MLIDTFTFFNELDVLEIRLKELNPYVDYFVLVEGSKTQSGNEKPYYFEENKHKFEKYLNKIIHIKVDDWPERHSAWDFDIYQRQQIRRGIDIIGPEDSDIIMVSDVDEIPFPRVVPIINLPRFSVTQMFYHVYYYNLQVANGFRWNGTVAAPWSDVKKTDIHSFIKRRDGCNPIYIIPDGGIHYGYQGGPDVVFHKYFSCVEPFDKINGIPGKEVFDQIFEERARDGGCFIFSDNLANTSLPLIQVSLGDLHDTIQTDRKYQIK